MRAVGCGLPSAAHLAVFLLDACMPWSQPVSVQQKAGEQNTHGPSAAVLLFIILPPRSHGLVGGATGTCHKPGRRQKSMICTLHLTSSVVCSWQNAKGNACIRTHLCFASSLASICSSLASKGRHLLDEVVDVAEGVKYGRQREEPAESAVQRDAGVEWHQIPQRRVPAAAM